MKYLSRMGWRRREPGSIATPEEPELLNQALGLLQKNGMPLERIVADAKLLPAGRFRSELRLEPRVPVTVSLN